MSTALPSYDEAAGLVASHAARLSFRRASEDIELSRAAGRVLARSLSADRDQPSFARSTRDGYACRAAEASAHGQLSIAGSTRAGDAPGGPLPPHAAWEIMTGGAIPEGADAVLMLEHVEARDQSVRLLPPRTIAEGENIVAQGAQARAGDELLPAGISIDYTQIALAASCGCSKLAVFPRPRVAILTTGDEIVPVDVNPAHGQIRNSNGPMLAALVAEAGGEPWVLPSAADNAEALDAALAQGANADLLLITGGVSAGKFDLVELALARRGARFHFTGVRMQPGKPVVFAEMLTSNTDLIDDQCRTKYCFGLPGNPVSSAVTFLLFAAPVLAALSGRFDRGPRVALARLASEVKGNGLTRFLPARCTFAGEQPEVSLVKWQGSGDLAAMARSNCFLIVPEDTDRLTAGTIVRILLS